MINATRSATCEATGSRSGRQENSNDSAPPTMSPSVSAHMIICRVFSASGPNSRVAGTTRSLSCAMGAPQNGRKHPARNRTPAPSPGRTANVRTTNGPRRRSRLRTPRRPGSRWDGAGSSARTPAARAGSSGRSSNSRQRTRADPKARSGPDRTCPPRDRAAAPRVPSPRARHRPRCRNEPRGQPSRRVCSRPCRPALARVNE